MDRLIDCILQTGFTQTGFVNTADIVIHEEVRRLCEGNMCRSYGTTWACPPAVGTLRECEARLRQYGRMILFSKKYDLEDPYDFEAMREGHRDFQKQVDRLDDALKRMIRGYLILSNEGCVRCEKCTYPDMPCRFPEKLHPSIEGFGLIVSELAQSASIRYINGENTVTYFGAVLTV